MTYYLLRIESPHYRLRLQCFETYRAAVAQGLLVCQSLDICKFEIEEVRTFKRCHTYTADLSRRSVVGDIDKYLFRHTLKE